MKILFVSDVPIQNPASGSEKVLYQQVTGLASKEDNVLAITRENRKFKSTEFHKYDNLQDACYSVDTNNSFFSLLTILKKPPYLFNKLKNEIPFSLVISHQPLTCFSLILSKKLDQTPFLYVYHSPSHLEYELLNDGRPSFKHLIHVIVRKWIERFCLKKTSKIMVLSHYMKEKIQHIHKIPANHIVVNPGGVDLSFFRPFDNRKQIKSELGLPENSIHLLTVRNLEPRMGLDNLLKAIYLLRKRQVEAYLVIGGEGPERDNLHNQINKYDLSNDVVMAGFIPNEKLSKYYNAADFFILPTRKLEGFGLVTPESMACGTPVCGTPVGGTKEILANFNNDCLFKNSSPEAIAEGIQKIIKFYSPNSEKYEDLRQKCRRYAEHNYSWHQHVEKLKSEIMKITQIT